MTLDELHKHFNYNWAKVARTLQIGDSTIVRWRKSGFIPANWQLKIQTITNGRLIARWQDAAPAKGGLR